MKPSCGRCSQRAKCQIPCPEAELFAGKDYVSQREITIGVPMFGQRIQEIWEHKKLTFRERQVWSLANGGFNREQIGETLNIKRETVKFYIYQIRQKTGVKSFTT
jgi:DNA-binding NarL/FixJ family response regulator